MIKALAAVAALYALAVSTSASAQDPKSLSSSFIPKTGFFSRAGGSFNWDRFDQSLQGISGVSDVFIGPDLVADGQAGGPPTHFNRDDTGFVFDADVGYSQRLYARQQLTWQPFGITPTRCSDERGSKANRGRLQIGSARGQAKILQRSRSLRHVDAVVAAILLHRILFLLVEADADRQEGRFAA
jgi:hypothetical protein